MTETICQTILNIGFITLASIAIIQTMKTVRRLKMISGVLEKD